MNKTINYLIIDDERLAREELKSLLKNELNYVLVGEASNAMEGLDAIKTLSPDLIFLDIHMPEMNGLEMLKKLDNIPQVIFTTAYDEYAIEAFELDALDYLLKPIDPKRLSSALSKITKQDDFETALPSLKRAKVSMTDKLFLRENEKCWLIEMKEICYFKSDGNYVKIHFGNNVPSIVNTLNAIEEKLDANHFFRVNRQYIINLNFIQTIQNWFNGGFRLALMNGEVVDASRRQAALFREQFGL